MSEIERAIESLQNIIEHWTYKPEEVAAAKLAIEALKEKQRREAAGPCDVCAFNPPSSMDGKPCSMCVAVPKSAEQTELEG